MTRLSLLLTGLLVLFSVPAHAAEKFRVAYIPCGRVNDQSWSQAGYEGLLAARKNVDIDIAYSESVPASNVEAAARDYAAQGYNLIMLHCGTFPAAGLKVALDYPKTWFQLVTAPSTPDNVISINLAQQEGAFVAGVMAGLTTKTNKLGAIVSFNTLGYNRQAEGFRLGARFVNPKIEYYVTYMNSAEDAAKAKEAALAQYDAGADIILAAADQAASGVFQAAEEDQKFVVAEYADQNAMAPKVILGSLLFNQTLLLEQVVESVAAGNAKSGYIHPGLKQGVGTFVKNAPLMATIPEAARTCMTLVRQAILDDQITLPGDPVIGHQNAAKTIDTKSLLTGGPASPCLDKKS
jgi:basic membrane protein A